jgi:hypothetical protein
MSIFPFTSGKGKIIRHAVCKFFDVKEDSMKSKSIPILAFFAILSVCLFLSFNAAADDQTCVLKADTEDVHVYVQDKDDEGNDQDKVFEGWIKAGQEVQIRSQTGRISYSYKERSDDRSYGDNHAECKDGDIIRVP